MRRFVSCCVLVVLCATLMAVASGMRVRPQQHMRTLHKKLQARTTRFNTPQSPNPLALIEELNARHRAGQSLSMLEAASFSKHLAAVTEARSLPYAGFVGSVCSCVSDTTHWLNSRGNVIGFTAVTAACNTTTGFTHPLSSCPCHNLRVEDCTHTTPNTQQEILGAAMHNQHCVSEDERTEGECQGNPCHNGGTRRVVVKRKAEIAVDTASSSQRTKVTCVEEIYQEPCTTPAPCDCQLGDWGSWGACVVPTGTCGDGVRTRSRTVLQAAINGGNCNAVETLPCNIECTINCAWTWNPYGPCSETCGDGVQTRSKNISQPASGGGTPCGDLSESRGCNIGQCACVMSNWSDWSQCSATCMTPQQATPTQTRTRTIVKQGSACGFTSESRPCNTHLCDKDCMLSAWSNWSACTHSCGNGTTTRSRTVLEAATGNGHCGATNEQRACNNQACPVDCKLGSFTEWSECDALCGNGTQSREALILTPPANGGAQCPATIQQRNCKLADCPQNCQLGNWSAWSACSQECGSGLQERWRDVTSPALHGGTCLAATHQQQICNTHECPRDCVVSNWTEWDECSVQCGGGTQSRRRTVIQPRQGSGTACPETEQTKQCNTHGCAVDCQVSEWSLWSQCAGPCGDGLKQRIRNVVVPPANGGKPCNGTVEMSPCVHEQGCNPSCVTTNWSSWSPCSHSCGGGQSTRSRSIVELRNGATASSCGVLSESVTCGQTECTVDCVMSNWSAWGNCSAECGGGLQMRQRTIKTPASGGGACGESVQYQECGIAACPVNCQMSAWQPWSTCSVSCGNGTRHRSRSVIVPAGSSGTACGRTQDTGACFLQHCPVDAKLSPWSDWSECSRSCGGGLMQRIRVVSVPAAYGGRPAEGSTRELKECNRAACTVACQVGNWSSWSTCSATCGGGVQTRTRQVVSTAEHVSSCPPLNETRACGNVSCPMDCQVSAWSGWSECLQGKRKRTRSVITAPRGDGGKCGALEEVEACEGASDCIVTPFSEFSDCSVTCGNGTKIRVRKVHRPPSAGGRACPALQETQPCTGSTPSCNTTTAPTTGCAETASGSGCEECQHLAWSSWTPCHPPCPHAQAQAQPPADLKLTAGLQQRVRKVHAGPEHCKAKLHQRPCQLEEAVASPARPEPGVNCVAPHILH